MNLTELRKKVTDVDFSKHIFTNKDLGEVVIYKFAIPDTNYQSITFINAYGIMAVTGDYGNWIFCREFHVSDDGYVSRGYWCEKLRTASTQHTGDFDPEGTREEMIKKINKNIRGTFSVIDVVDLIEADRKRIVQPLVKAIDICNLDKMPLSARVNFLFDAVDETLKLAGVQNAK